MKTETPIINPETIHRTDKTLELNIHRAFFLLTAIRSEPLIRDHLRETLGWSDDVDEQIWNLLYQVKRGGEAVADRSNVVKHAIAECERWQKTHLVVGRATLQHTHPDQAAFVLANVVPGEGMEAVMAVAVFVEQLQALESSPDRKASRKADHAALDVLEQRGITKAIRKEARDLVDTALKAELPPVPADTRETYIASLNAVYVWFQYWSELIRTAVTRREWLIRLGLATRRAPKRKGTAPPTAPPDAPRIELLRLAPAPPKRDGDAAPDSRAA